MAINPSEKNNTQHPAKDVNKEKDKIQDLHGDTEDNKGNYRKGKGTGMSSEAGSEQSERSWQGTSGSHANRNAEDADDNGSRQDYTDSRNSNIEDLHMKEDKSEWSKKGDNA